MDQQVALIGRTLINRPNVEKLIRQSDLDLTVHSDAQREDLIDTVMRNIKLDGFKGNLYAISYRDPNPERARKVVQGLLNIFMESSVGSKQKDTQHAVNFVDDQIKRYEQSLSAAEQRIKDFKIKYLGVRARDGNDYFGRMSQLQSDIDAAKLELQANEQARDSYKKDLAGETPTLLPELSNNAASEQATEFDVRIATLHKELDELLRKYTESHPDVISTRRLLQDLEQQRKAALDARRNSSSRRAACSIELMDADPQITRLDRSAKAITPLNATNRLQSPPANSTARRRRTRTKAGSVSIDTMPRNGRFDTSRSIPGEWKVGKAWLTARLVTSPAPMAISDASPSSMMRVGGTGSGDTRGGSMTRNCAPPVSCTSLPMAAASRLARRFS
jgi:polysaccharide chain length determinant protein (PEP-CTERM system associated)